MNRPLSIPAALAGLSLAMAWPAGAQEPGAPEPPAKTDVSVGARMLEHSSYYSPKWSAANLINGFETSGWCSKAHAEMPHHFIVELAESSKITSVEAVNATDETRYPGISAKRVGLEGSMKGAKGPWSPITELTLEAKPGVQTVACEEATARWIRITIPENHGHADYTELMNLRFLGAYVKPERKPVDINGVWMSTWSRSPSGGGQAKVRLQREGDRVFSTYEHYEGRLAGGFDRRVMTYRWTQTNGSGTVTVAINEEGDAMQGFWLYDGNPEPSGWWRFKVVGHTDSQGTDACNLELSKKRAASVVTWLGSKGSVAADRLASEGMGESKPVASNANELGRAANRRVELIKF